MRRVVQREDEEVDDLCNAVTEAIDEGVSRFPGKTYEEGVRAMAEWLYADTEDHPYPPGV